MSTFSWSQTAAVDNQEIETLEVNGVSLDINKTVYTLQSAEGFYNQDKDAALMARIFPIAFSQMQEDFNSGKAETKYDTLEKETLTIDGITYLYLKQYTRQEDSETIIVFYCKEDTDTTSIMISGYYKNGSESDSFDANIKAAALSAKVKL